MACGLTSCSSLINLYHSAEGGAIAQKRQPPPGENAPYPNLGRIPGAPAAMTPAERQSAVAQATNGTPGAVVSGTIVSGGVSGVSPDALAGLELPDAIPPAPAISGIAIPPVPSPVAPPAPAAAPAPVVRANGAAVSLAFMPHSAVLVPETATALLAIAIGHGQAFILVGGFGEAAAPGDQRALQLALARARRLADALTADGVPYEAILLYAAATGSGGFAQLVY